YSRSAEMLFESISTSSSYADSQYFALAFLWRQAIELFLKALIEDLNALPGATSAAPVSGHDLQRLWGEVERRLPEDMRAQNEPTIANITRVIDQFHKVDPRAEEFRYPTRMKDGTNTLTDLPRVVNFAELNETMQGLWNVLMAASFEIRRRLDF